MAFSTHALPKPSVVAAATALAGGGDGAPVEGGLTGGGASTATSPTSSAAAAPTTTGATCSPTFLDDGHGSGWAPIALTARGGWAGAAQQAGSVSKPENAARSTKSSTADTRIEAAATDAAAALRGPPVVDPVAIMQKVLDEHKKKSKGRHVLSDKDTSGLLATTALKTLVVLLAPPPQSCSCAQQPCASRQQPCGVGAIVVHAKEPKTTAAIRCLSAFFAKLVGAVKAATSALKKAHGGPENAYDDMSSANNSSDDVSSGSNDTATTIRNTTATASLECPPWVTARVCGAEWSNVTVLSDTNIAKANLSNGSANSLHYTHRLERNNFAGFERKITRQD